MKVYRCESLLPSSWQAISLGDTIKFSLSPSPSRDSLTTNAPGVPLDSSNLVSGGVPDKWFRLWWIADCLMTSRLVDFPEKASRIIE